jgi:phosphoribosyl 1,2-cyclic phosphodiesterase
MTGRFSVLASGSSGNASLLAVNGDAWLIDFGLPPGVIGERLAAGGWAWRDVRAALLTHTHGDHWNRDTLEHLRRLNVPLIAHAGHHDKLASQKTYDPLRRAGLIGTYAEGGPVTLAPGVVLRAVRAPHDADPTFGFRLDFTAGESGWSLGYVSDAGHVTPALVDAFADVDLLAVEFNHDVALQRGSGRHPMLVGRVLGPHGHLSNDQAGELVEAVARRSPPGRLRHVVQLHLSQDCNTAALAVAAGRAALARVGSDAAVTTATQYAATTALELSARPLAPSAAKFTIAVPRPVQPTLFGDE